MSSSPHNIKEMTRIGHYDILDCIGRGGMGLVYLARDTRLDRQVAIKCLRTELFEPHYRERFKREALLLAKLNHPNIVQIYDFIETPDQLALVMEYVDGQNLQVRLREHLVPLSQRMAWLTQIAQGLAVAHDSGIIHRDLKLENILINQRNAAKISDLGIAKSQDFNATITDHVAGSYASMSPEQAMGEALDFKSDLFSLGILAYQLLCGAHPFGETDNKLQLMQRIISHPPVPPAKHNPNLPAEIVDLLGQLLSKNIDNRPDNTHWVASQFEKLSPLVVGAPEWSNDTELTPQQASPNNSRTSNTAAYTRSVNDFSTFDTHYAGAPATQENRVANFITQQKTTIAVAVIFLVVLTGISLWLLQPTPPKYIAVIPPTLKAESMHESQQELVKAAVYDAIQQSVIELNNYYLIPRSEIANVDGDNETVRRATAADELITTEVNCKNEACAITLARLVPDSHGARLRVHGKKTIDVLTDKYLSVASITQSNTTSLYSSKLVNSFEKISNEDYEDFLEINHSYRSQGASSQLLEQLNLLSPATKQLDAVETLYKDISLDLFYEKREAGYLDLLAKQLLANNSQKPNHLYNLYYLYIAQNNFDEAKAVFEKLKNHNIGTSAEHELTAYEAMARNDYTSAITNFEKSLKLKYTADTLINTANAYWYSGDTATAKKYLNQSLTLSPNHHKGHSLNGLIALVDGDIATAKTSFERVIAAKPNDLSNLNNLGLCYLLMHEFDNAQAIFARAARLAPENSTYQLNQADAENLAGNTTASIETYRRIVEAFPRDEADSNRLRHLAQAHAHVGEFSEALDILRSLEKIDSQNIETTYTSALVHTLASNETSAIFYIENALEAGMNKSWFNFAWFNSLCHSQGFRALMEQHGEPERCVLHAATQ